MDFQVKLRLGVAKFFPGFPDVQCLLFGSFLRRMTENDGARFQGGSGAKNTVPQIAGCHDRQADGLAALLRDR